MGWMDWLKVAGAGAATAFTGGAAAPLLVSSVGSALSNTAAARQQGRQQQDAMNFNRDSLRLDATTAQQRAELDAIMADLAQREYVDSRRGANVGDALRGSALQNIQDVSITPPPGVNMAEISGGLRPSMFVNRGAVGSELERQAMLELLNPIGPGGIDRGGSSAPASSGRRMGEGSIDTGRTAMRRDGSSPMPEAIDVDGGGPQYSRSLPSIRVLPLPELSEPTQPGALDKFLSFAGPAMSAAGQIYGAAQANGAGSATGSSPMMTDFGAAAGRRRLPVPSTLG